MNQSVQSKPPRPRARSAWPRAYASPRPALPRDSYASAVCSSVSTSSEASTRDGGGKSVLMDGFREARLVDELDDERRRRARAATGKDEYFVEDLHRRISPNTNDNQAGHQQRERNARELPPRWRQSISAPS